MAVSWWIVALLSSARSGKQCSLCVHCCSRQEDFGRCSRPKLIKDVRLQLSHKHKGLALIKSVTG